MREEECTLFLQWALPRLDLAWPGFRKVRNQVCKRLRRRMRDLGVESYAAYREKLEADPAEWQALDSFCRITISRFCRDRGTFDLSCRGSRIKPGPWGEEQGHGRRAVPPARSPTR